MLSVWNEQRNTGKQNVLELFINIWKCVYFTADEIYTMLHCAGIHASHYLAGSISHMSLKYWLCNVQLPNQVVKYLIQCKSCRSYETTGLLEKTIAFTSTSPPPTIRLLCHPIYWLAVWLANINKTLLTYLHSFTPYLHVLAALGRTEVMGWVFCYFVCDQYNHVIGCLS